MTYLPPGSRLGVIGAGQLGRMFAKAALRLGYRVHMLSAEPEAPALTLANRAVVCSPDDADAIADFASGCDAVTVESESIEPRVLEQVASHAPMLPSAACVALAGDRMREKSFLRDHGFPVGPFSPVRSEEDLLTAVQTLGTPFLLKTCRGGYDGRSRVRVEDGNEAAGAWASLGQCPCIAEGFIDFQAELSIIVARSADGTVSICGPMRNEHRNGILHQSQLPGEFSAATDLESRDMGREVAEALEYVGVLCIEMFLTRDQRLLINELAPRPHNSGHLTLEACYTDQFEQQVRMMCGLPTGSFAVRQPAAMLNLLGDLWAEGEPNWATLLREPRLKLHLYGKAAARRGRKMGHLMALAETPAEALQVLSWAQQQLMDGAKPKQIRF